MANDFNKISQMLATIEINKPFWQDKDYEVYIYGTGSFGQDVLQALIEHGVSVQGFLDHIKRDDSLYQGFPVFLPEEPITSHNNSAKAVVLAIHNPFGNLVEIHNKLVTLGYKRIITPIELFDHLDSSLGNRYWLTNRAFYHSMSIFLEKTYRLWSDDASRSIFIRIIKHRLTGDYSILPQPDWDNHYAPKDIPAWQSPIRMIDCGAFDGDSLQDILNTGATFEALAAFEPDLATFKKLKTFIYQNREYFPNSILWPCGAYSSTTKLPFNTNLGASSGIANTGNTAIQCVAIDDVLPDFQPTLIKMDIEGAEYDALLGAQKTITKNKPGLAISLYHTPAHLWQIPLLVDRLANSKTMDWNTEAQVSYLYFLRTHSANGYDLVFYAIPTLNE
jgi:FkbM family methyltransferase